MIYENTVILIYKNTVILSEAKNLKKKEDTTMKNINKRTKLAVSALLLLTLIATTWAYFNQTSEIGNKFNTKNHGVETIEEFTPEQELLPGETIDKKVGVKNTGDYGLVVRIRFDEKWERGGSEIIAISSEDNGAFNNAIASAVMDGQGRVTSTQVHKTDGLVAGDETVIYKNLPGLTDGTWTKGNDGYYYYKTILTAKQSTSSLLASITFAGDADLGFYAAPVEKYSTTASSVIVSLQATYNTTLAAYEADKDNAAKEAAFKAAETALEAGYAWSTSKPADTSKITYQKVSTSVDPNRLGYSNANYTLTVVTQVCQATEEAVEEAWTGMDAGVKAAWALQ